MAISNCLLKFVGRASSAVMKLNSISSIMLGVEDDVVHRRWSLGLYDNFNIQHI